MEEQEEKETQKEKEEQEQNAVVRIVNSGWGNEEPPMVPAPWKNAPTPRPTTMPPPPPVLKAELLNENDGPTLILCPTSCLMQWWDEIVRHTAPVC
jgi:hypothetical protein